MTHRYNVLLRARVNELGISYLQFFEAAHQWRFGRVGTLNDDYCQFLQHAIVPKYVQAYLDHIYGGLNGKELHEVRQEGASAGLDEVHLDPRHPSH